MLELDLWDPPSLPGWQLSPIWTPGHSPGYICIWDEVNTLLSSGGHVLPRITPNLPSRFEEESRNPLRDFLEPLENLRDYDAINILPVHEFVFSSLEGRLSELQEHHRERLKEIVEVLERSPASAWEVAHELMSSRS